MTERDATVTSPADAVADAAPGGGDVVHDVDVANDYHPRRSAPVAQAPEDPA